MHKLTWYVHVHDVLIKFKPCSTITVISNIEAFFHCTCPNRWCWQKLCFISVKLWVHTAILSIKTVCWAHKFQVPEKSYNIRPWSYIRDFFSCIRPWSSQWVVLCSGKTGTIIIIHIKVQCIQHSNSSSSSSSSSSSRSSSSISSSSSSSSAGTVSTDLASSLADLSLSRCPISECVRKKRISGSGIRPWYIHKQAIHINSFTAGISKSL